MMIEEPLSDETALKGLERPAPNEMLSIDVVRVYLSTCRWIALIRQWLERMK